MRADFTDLQVQIQGTYIFLRVIIIKHTLGKYLIAVHLSVFDVDKDSVHMDANISLRFGTYLKYSWEIMLSIVSLIQSKMADWRPFCFQMFR